MFELRCRDVLGSNGCAIIVDMQHVRSWELHSKQWGGIVLDVHDGVVLVSGLERLHQLWLGDLRILDGVDRLHVMRCGQILYPGRCFLVVIVCGLCVGELLCEPRVIGVLGVRRRFVLCSEFQRLLELRIGYLRCELELEQLHGMCSRQLLNRDGGRDVVDLHELPGRDVCFEQQYDDMLAVRWRDLLGSGDVELRGMQRGLIPAAGRIVELCGVQCRNILDVDGRRIIISVRWLCCRPVRLQLSSHDMLAVLGRQLLSRWGEQLHELFRRHLPIDHKRIELHGVPGEYILDSRRGGELSHVHSLSTGLSTGHHRCC